MCRRFFADVIGTFLILVYIAECSPTARRCSAIYRRWYVESKHREMVITRVHGRSFAEPLVHGGAGLAMPKFVHRESIGRLKKPRGTVA